MPKKKSHRESGQSLPEEPARPAPPALRGRRNAADLLLERLRRGPDPNYDPDKEFEEWYATALANPPVDEVRDRERRAMLETADTLLHSRHRELEAACRADDTTRQKSLLLEIEKMEQGRARWLEFYDSDQFAEQVGISWRLNMSEHKEEFRKRGEEVCQRGRADAERFMQEAKQWHKAAVAVTWPVKHCGKWRFNTRGRGVVPRPWSLTRGSAYFEVDGLKWFDRDANRRLGAYEATRRTR